MLITVENPVDFFLLNHKMTHLFAFSDPLIIDKVKMCIYITFVAEKGRKPCYLPPFVVYYYCMFLCAFGAKGWILQHERSD